MGRGRNRPSGCFMGHRPPGRTWWLKVATRQQRHLRKCRQPLCVWGPEEGILGDPLHRRHPRFHGKEKDSCFAGFLQMPTTGVLLTSRCAQRWGLPWESPAEWGTLHCGGSRRKATRETGGARTADALESLDLSPGPHLSKTTTLSHSHRTRAEAGNPGTDRSQALF